MYIIYILYIYKNFPLFVRALKCDTYGYEICIFFYSNASIYVDSRYINILCLVYLNHCAKKLIIEVHNRMFMDF